MLTIALPASSMQAANYVFCVKWTERIMNDFQKHILESHGLRWTRQRQVVFEALQHTKSHPTAEELHQMCCQTMPGMSLATVYNALEKLADADLVTKLPGAGVNGSARYDAAVDDHPHVRCTRTGRIADLPDEVSDRIVKNIPKRLIRELENELGFRVNKVQIELLGEFVEQEQKNKKQTQAA